MSTTPADAPPVASPPGAGRRAGPPPPPPKGGASAAGARDGDEGGAGAGGSGGGRPRQQRPGVIRLAPPVSAEPPEDAGPRPRRSRLRRLLPFIACVLLPFALVSVYYLALATERYVAEAKFTVRQDAPAQVPSVDLGLIGAVGSPAREDAYIIREYILSADMLRVLNERMGLRAAWRDGRIDWWTRLPADASDEEFLAYYRGMIEVVFDDASSILTVRLQGFDPARTEATLELLLAESERFVNELSRHLARQELAFVEGEVARAEARLRVAQQRVLAYQNELELVDPATSSQSVMRIIADLESQLARSEAELKALRTYVRPEAPQIVALEARIGATRQQIAAERGRLAGAGGGRLNDAALGFDTVRLEQEFALGAYKGAVAALEAARIEASKKLKNVVVVVSPNRPDEALHPRRARAIGTALVVLLLLYGVGSLVVATVRDHLD